MDKDTLVNKIIGLGLSDLQKAQALKELEATPSLLALWGPKQPQDLATAIQNFLTPAASQDRILQVMETIVRNQKQMMNLLIPTETFSRVSAPSVGNLLQKIKIDLSVLKQRVDVVHCNHQFQYFNWNEGKSVPKIPPISAFPKSEIQKDAKDSRELKHTPAAIEHMMNQYRSAFPGSIWNLHQATHECNMDLFTSEKRFIGGTDVVFLEIEGGQEGQSEELIGKNEEEEYSAKKEEEEEEYSAKKEEKTHFSLKQVRALVELKTKCEAFHVHQLVLEFIAFQMVSNVPIVAFLTDFNTLVVMWYNDALYTMNFSFRSSGKQKEIASDILYQTLNSLEKGTKSGFPWDERKRLPNMRDIVVTPPRDNNDEDEQDNDKDEQGGNNDNIGETHKKDRDFKKPEKRDEKRRRIENYSKGILGYEFKDTTTLWRLRDDLSPSEYLQEFFRRVVPIHSV